MSGALSVLGAFGKGLAGGYGARKELDLREQEAAARAAEAAATPAMGAYRPGVDSAQGYRPGGGGGGGMGGATPGTLHELLDRTEGAADYDTLFGHAQREGGRFAGVRPTQMTLGELYQFTDPSGEYGQWVKSTNPEGVVATPLGRGQIVGTTLRATAKAMGLPDDTVFNQATQDAMIAHLANARLERGGGDRTAQMRELRAEWAGFKHVPDNELLAAIENWEARGGVVRPRQRPLGVGPVVMATKGN